MPTITITKIDRDDYIGYYIGDKLYCYTEYCDITDDQVVLEATVQAFESKIISSRYEVKIEWVEKYDLEGYSHNADEDAASHDLPSSLAVLKAHYLNYGED